MPRWSSVQFLQCCGYFLYWLPRVFSSAAVAWGTISHIVYASTIEFFLARWILLFVGVVSGVLAEIAYFRTWFHGPGSPREFVDFYVGNDCEAQLGCDPHSIPDVLQDAIEAKSDGGVRYCSKCHVFKPDRTHHCRQCGMCVLRMDHHCVWFSSCVGLRNHKYFLQFLVYVSLLCLAAFCTALPLVIEFFGSHAYDTELIGINFVFYTVLSGVFGMVLPAFSLYSLYNAAINRTTLESMEPTAYRTALAANKWRYRQPPSRDNLGNVYDMGITNNLNQVLGPTWVDWLLPLRTRLPVDGSRFPINEELRAKAEERAQTEIAMHQRKQRWLDQQQQQQVPPE